MNTTTLPAGSVTMNTYLYESVIQDTSDSFQMVITPIYFKNRILDGGGDEIPYISNHVVTSKGDHYLCFTMEPEISSISHVVVKITSEEMDQILASIEFKKKYSSIILKKPTIIFHSNISLEYLNSIKLLHSSFVIIEHGICITSFRFSSGIPEEKSSSTNGIALPIDSQTSLDLYDHESFPVIFHSTTIETKLRFDCIDPIDLGANQCEKSNSHYQEQILSSLNNAEEEPALGL